MDTIAIPASMFSAFCGGSLWKSANEREESSTRKPKGASAVRNSSTNRSWNWSTSSAFRVNVSTSEFLKIWRTESLVKVLLRCTDELALESADKEVFRPKVEDELDERFKVSVGIWRR